MLSINCPACGQKMAAIEGKCAVNTVCHKCRCEFKARIDGENVGYEIVRESGDKKRASGHGA